MVGQSYNYQYEKQRVFFMIDSKSFYASVESVELGLNPLRSILVVMSEQANTNGGLVLAASPMAKKKLGASNIMRQRDLPRDKKLIIVHPRMNLYIQENLRINSIYREYTTEEKLLAYSIDESLLDVTDTWAFFGDSPEIVARKIQERVRKETGIYLTVGIGDSPVLAKIALDIEAKHAPNLMGVWHYADVPKKLWPITQLNDIWSIGKRTALKLNNMGVNSMYDLAHQDPYIFRAKMGIVGEQLYALSWGIDRSDLTEVIVPKSKSYSNSQVLPRDYHKREEIEIVIREMVDQVASRIRFHQKQATIVSLFIGYSYAESEKQSSHGFRKQLRIDATNDTRKLMEIMIQLFEQNWHGEVIRHIGIDYSGLIDAMGIQLDLFRQPEQQINTNKIDQVVDELRQRFGTTAIMRAMSKLEGGTAIDRANLVGGHNGGNSYE
ncbi:Y-family DNA polymerase [Leuconostoc gelidum subsp. gelidum]|uniref:Y-family DNA polymerase n=1 Tax=Leuconostoc gelidum subsp. gelidum TaxID=1607839 RepID=A0AB35G000_LEUGE|nr:Y-family DNA polymerase [Leuconostoc gelidum]MBZ5963606.1 Y-family DNA polymerase [Leuconostoc gelidum subsp. gelidum]MBZ5975552.1 Y-family DNA polymerase [Leuconostoc gelidum subsp. gelidum]MBZ5976280.1 Y-family DNA polymerase [Leuconostoc gelidum subsp. gelidum]MBZ5987063.1 Y-family DNA polymerase [Leuconostoc gelidum subsp. gelidum]MBZ6000260.1 Y-family DNA polymerase [Leuconostoc gelidum subsp. gelidum]